MSVDTTTVWTSLHADLWRYIRRRVADDHTADDLLQETFLRVHRGIGGLSDDDRLAGWVYRIARNVITDHYRQRTAEPLGDGDLEAGVPVDRQALVKAMAGKWLPELIESLPKTYREAVRLAELEGISQQEVAERLGLTLSGAKSRVRRGRVALKDALLQCCRFDLDRRGNIIECEPRPDRATCAGCEEAEVAE
jgi:RNA polymerase sigma-70 factor (ECF subfamily)